MEKCSVGCRETESVQQIIYFDDICYRIHAASVPSSACTRFINRRTSALCASASSIEKRNSKVGAEAAYLPRYKSLYARLEIRSCSAMASWVNAFCCRREDNSSERSSASSAGYGFILKTSIVYNRSTMEILCRNEACFHEAHFMFAVQIL